ATELHSTAASYQSVISGLTTVGWAGPASASMAAAAAPYAMWMSTTAGLAEQTAAQANAAAAAYEAAFAMTVPPPVIAANRIQLASLVATNVLGQNTPAIAATEAHYGEMWAQDAAAMYSYAGNAAAASKVTPFTPPQQTTNPAGLAGQSAAVAQATGTSAATNAQSTLSQLTSTMPTALQGLGSPMAASGSGSGSLGGLNILGGTSGDVIPGMTTGDFGNAVTNLLSSSFSPMSLAGITQIGSDLAVIRGAMLDAADPLGLGALDAAELVSPASSSGIATFGSVSSGGAGAVSAGLGRATSVGALSVPQSWAATTPVATTTVTPAPATGWSAAVPHAEPTGMPGTPGMPAASSGGRGFGFAAPRYGFKPTVMARPVVAG
ncbi:MAG: PPE family protein, partial [Mycobacterium sp.]|nr:PPE family protein [Mycobacterium sp.]